MTFAIPAEVRTWVKPGLAGMIAIAGAGAIEIVRFWALRFRDDSNVLEAYVQRAAAAKAIALLGNGARAAVNAVDVSSYRSRTFKGFCTLGPSEIDQSFAAACVVAQQHAFESVGLPEDTAERMMAHADSAGLLGWRVTVDAVFDQSPKLGAGARL